MGVERASEIHSLE